MNKFGEDYAPKSWLAVTALIVVLVAVSFIPPQSVGGVKLRRANILSDLVSFDDAPVANTVFEPAIDELVRIDLDSVAGCIVAADTLPPAAQIVYAWSPLPDSLSEFVARRLPVVPDSTLSSPALVPVEDFSGGQMEAF